VPTGDSKARPPQKGNEMGEKKSDAHSLNPEEEKESKKVFGLAIRQGAGSEEKTASPQERLRGKSFYIELQQRETKKKVL